MSRTVLKLATPLRKFVGGAAELEFRAASVRELLDKVTEAHPALRSRLFSASSELHRFVAVYVGNQNIRSRDGLATLLNGEPVSLVVAVAGG